MFYESLEQFMNHYLLEFSRRSFLQSAAYGIGVALRFSRKRPVAVCLPNTVE